MNEYGSMFGLGEKTGVEINEASGGRIPSLTMLKVLFETGKSSATVTFDSSIEPFEPLMIAFKKCSSYLVPLLAIVAQ